METQKRVARRLSDTEFALDFKFNKEMQRKLKVYFDATWQRPYWHVHAVSERRKRAFRDFLEKENFQTVEAVPEENEETPKELGPISELPWEE